MQKRKFDELISHFNRKVSDMSIDQKYKMELLGMISAIGFAHEKEHGTNLASLGTDCISRQAAIDALENDKAALDKIIKGMSAEDMLLKYYVAQHNQVSCDIYAIVQLPPIQPADNLQKLADEIASFKRNVKSDNSDYLTGYLCALSVVEGMIAEMREVTT